MAREAARRSLMRGCHAAQGGSLLAGRTTPSRIQSRSGLPQTSWRPSGPTPLSRANLRSPASDARKLGGQTSQAARRPIGSAGKPGGDADGGSGTDETRSSADRRVGQHHVQRGIARLGGAAWTPLARGDCHPLITNARSRVVRCSSGGSAFVEERADWADDVLGLVQEEEMAAPFDDVQARVGQACGEQAAVA
jgi:hypothetical protein